MTRASALLRGYISGAPARGGATGFYEFDPFAGASLVVSYGTGKHMPGTAVVRIYVGEGFVVAADGLRRDGAGKEINATQQKVFEAQYGSKILAYAATGTTYLDQAPGGFDVCGEVAHLADAVLRKGYDSPYRYTEEFGKALKRSLRGGQEDHRIVEFIDFGRGGLIVCVLFAGYYEGRAFLSKVALLQEEQQVALPQLEYKDLVSSDIQLEISGSEKVKDSLWYTDDPRLSSFRSESCTRVRQKQPITLADGVDLARSYIAACRDPVGREIDPECAAIGGHIHVCTVTPSEGFKWVDPPVKNQP